MIIPFFKLLEIHDMDFGVRSDEWSNQTFKGHVGPILFLESWRAALCWFWIDVFYSREIQINYMATSRKKQWLGVEQDLAQVEKG